MTLPSEYPEVQGHQNLRRLLKDQVDMQFEDLRGLLRFPLSGTSLERSFNLTAAVLLLNLIAGSSVCFYKASVQGPSGVGDRGKRFKGVVRDFYYSAPLEVMTAHELANVLYYSVRNPLVHAFGLESPPTQATGQLVYLDKSSLSEAEISDLESYPLRSSWLASIPTAARQQRVDGENEVTIHISALYWGLQQMLHRLFADPVQVRSADKLAGDLIPRLDKYLTRPVSVSDVVSVIDEVHVKVQEPFPFLLISRTGRREVPCKPADP